MLHGIAPFGPAEIIGSYTVPADETFRRLSEFAAWWTDIRVPAGTYPVVLAGLVRPGECARKRTRRLWDECPGQDSRSRRLNGVDHEIIVALRRGEGGGKPPPNDPLPRRKLVP